MTLRVWTDGTDWVIAATAERAHELRASACNGGLDEFGELEDWKPLADEDRLRVHDQRDDSVLTLSAAEWVAREGKEGFLCSTEF